MTCKYQYTTETEIPGPSGTRIITNYMCELKANGLPMSAQLAEAFQNEFPDKLGVANMECQFHYQNAEDRCPAYEEE